MIFNKIKLNYNIKLIDDHFASNKFSEVKKILTDNYNTSIYLNLVDHVLKNHLSSNKKSDYFKSKFIWISSFNKNDTSFLNNFLKFYLNSQANFSYNLGYYKNQISDTFENLKTRNLPKKLTFDDVVNFSYLYQFLLLEHFNKDVIFSTTSSAFFEKDQKKFLIYPHTTLCSFYIIRNPYDLYNNFKTEFSNSQEALNELSDLNSKIDNDQRFTITENRQNWSTNVKSWSNSNVQNAYRGKIIKYEDFINSPEESLTEVVYHIKQTGLDIDLDFKIIEKFISENKLSQNVYDPISNKELKMVTNSLDIKLLKEFDYQGDD